MRLSSKVGYDLLWESPLFRQAGALIRQSLGWLYLRVWYYRQPNASFPMVQARQKQFLEAVQPELESS